MYTTQPELRKRFWREHPELAPLRKPGSQNNQTCLVRTEWCDWIDGLQKAGFISSELADRAIL